MTKMEEELDLNSVKKSLKVLNQDPLGCSSAGLRRLGRPFQGRFVPEDGLAVIRWLRRWRPPAKRSYVHCSPKARTSRRPAARPYQVQAAAEAYATGEAQLRASEAAMEVLNVILQAEQLLSELQTSRSFMSSTVGEAADRLPRKDIRWRAARGSAVGDDTNTFPPLAAVGKFLSFLGQSCTGEAEVYQVLGFSLYPRLVKLLSRHLEIQEAEAMGFEKHLSSEGFISPKESSLSRWAQQRHQAQKQGPQRLTQARRWILDESAARCVPRTNEARSLLGRMCHLFAILRPYVQGGLRSHLGRCGLFVTDVMFLLHQLRQLPVEYRPVKQMKVLEQRGQDELWAMLKHQEESSNAALGAAGEQAKRIARALSEVLPQVVLRKVTLHLLGAFCEEQKLLCPRAQEAVPFAGAGLSSGVAQVGRWLDTLATGAAGGDEFREVLAGLKKGPKGPSDAAAKEAPEGTAICVLSAEENELTNRSSELGEISSAVTLMTSAQSMVRQTLQAAALPLDQRLQEEVPGYERLLLSSDLLGSDFSRFLERRLKLAKSMSKEEAMRLMSLSFHDEALPSEDAWRILSAG
eukprot:g9966.t1